MLPCPPPATRTCDDPAAAKSRSAGTSSAQRHTGAADTSVTGWLVDHTAAVQTAAYLCAGRFCGGPAHRRHHSRLVPAGRGVDRRYRNLWPASPRDRTDRDGAPMTPYGTQRNEPRTSGFRGCREDPALLARPTDVQHQDHRDRWQQNSSAQRKEMMHHGVTDPSPSVHDRRPWPSVPATSSVAALALRPAARPLATVTSPAVVIHLADELLARTAIAQPDTNLVQCGCAPVGGTPGQRVAGRHRPRNRMGARDPFADRGH